MLLGVRGPQTMVPMWAEKHTCLYTKHHKSACLQAVRVENDLFGSQSYIPPSLGPRDSLSGGQGCPDLPQGIPRALAGGREIASMKGLQRTQANQHNRCDTFLAFTSFRSDRNDVNGTNATDATQRIERNQPNTTNAMQPLCSLRSVRNDLYTTNATHATQRNRCVRNERNVAKATQPTQRVVTNPHAWFSHRSGTFPKPQTRLPA